ncbi:MAG: TonB-dependent receptor [Deltaproteobacteria bacterium]|nr:TonB-dependent receptor [Deltaproteobacteria bacterium]
MTSFYRVIFLFSLFQLFTQGVSAESGEDINASHLDFRLEPLEVTSARIPTSFAEIGHSFSLLSEEELSLSQGHFLPELLQTLPGVRAQQLGGKGQLVSIRMRGLRAHDTKLLLDGMPLRDPSAPKGDAAGIMGDLVMDDIAALEVMRGASSMLYGSDATGGAISLIPHRRGQKEVLGIEVEGGSLSTLREALSLSGGHRSFHYSGGLSRLDTSGIDGHDDYANTSYRLSGSTRLTPELKADLQIRGFEVRQQLNKDPVVEHGSIIPAPDDPNDYRTGSLFFLGGSLRHEGSDRWSQSLRFNGVHSDRRFVAMKDPDGSGFDSELGLRGNLYHGEYQLNYSPSRHHLVTFGYEHEREALEQEVKGGGEKGRFSQYSNALFAQDQIRPFPVPFLLVPGVRLTFPERFSTLASGDLSASYLLNNWGTRLRTHIASGSRSPSLYELYGMSTAKGAEEIVGNSALRTEKSLSWDAGIEQSLFDEKTLLQLTFFDQRIWDAIRYRSHYENGPGLRSIGIESEWGHELHPTLSGRLFYTLTHARHADGESVEGVPDHSGGVELKWKGWKRLSSLMRLTYKGEEEQLLYPAPLYQPLHVAGEPYFKLDAALTYRVSEESQIFLKGSNLLDQRIIENGFRGEPAVVMAGLKAAI